MLKGLDHVAVPMESVDEMLAFYAGLGCKLSEDYPGYVHSVVFGDNKINFHMPKIWQSERFTLRGPTSLPGCGDFCFVWGGTSQALTDLLEKLNAPIEEGPVERLGGRAGSTVTGVSVYTRDPDSNLLEFIIYD
ncbi:MAG: hypothetical protein JKY67_16740 [Pseudomonadales bacterium]|nr:hypothetical protein [Pseudomonadales bacterium]